MADPYHQKDICWAVFSAQITEGDGMKIAREPDRGKFREICSKYRKQFEHAEESFLRPLNPTIKSLRLQ